MIEQIDADDPEAIELVGRFTAFSFTVSSMESVLSELAGRPIEWLSQREYQPWGGLLSFFKDPDGNVQRSPNIREAIKSFWRMNQVLGAQIFAACMSPNGSVAR